MIVPVPARLRDGQHWLRVADATWDDPLDPSYARHRGGRWNPPDSFPVLYLNEDLTTARSQIVHMLDGWPVDAEDLDPPFVLVTVVLPRRQIAADAVSDEGLDHLGLPPTYPLRGSALISHDECRPIGAAVKLVGLRGVHARSAVTPDGSGRELAWFPARRSSKATAVGEAIPFDRWWHPGSSV